MYRDSLRHILLLVFFIVGFFILDVFLIFREFGTILEL